MDRLNHLSPSASNSIEHRLMKGMNRERSKKRRWRIIADKYSSLIGRGSITTVPVLRTKANTLSATTRTKTGREDRPMLLAWLLTPEEDPLKETD